MGVSEIRDGSEVGDFQCWIAHGFTEKGAGFAIDGRREIGRIIGINKTDLNAKSGQDFGELRVSAAVEIAGRDDVIASGSEVDDAVEDAAGAGGQG